MSIEQIKERAEKADQLIAELSKQGRPDAAPEVEDPVDTEATQPPAVAPAADDPNRPLPPKGAEADATWEQRYRSLYGMIEARDRQITQLQQLLSDMHQSVQTQAPAQQPEAANKKRVGKEDEEAFGSDLIDLARRIADEENAQLH